MSMDIQPELDENVKRLISSVVVSIATIFQATYKNDPKLFYMVLNKALTTAGAIPTNDDIRRCMIKAYLQATIDILTMIDDQQDINTIKTLQDIVGEN